MREITIQLSNKVFYTLIAMMLVVLLGAGVLIVNAYGDPYGDASVMGHSANEIEGVCKSDGTGCPSLGSLPSGTVAAFDLSSCPSGWSEFTSAKGRVVVGLDSGQTEFNALEKIGGEKTHTLTINEIPSHTHTEVREGYTRGAQGLAQGFMSNPTTVQTGAAGGGQPHNNLQPYITLLYCRKN